ncbi:AFR453Wp [Eremothecium gossypii ATCC 10895]|uniref:Peroxisomal targeting signal receptor n=1 Tax=Eremothecium gossypii (strain ATCC 10895 / CBS 109.51 / FGSC 9923 / NRRL Y-1056) TaxID=284811 RepID=PEX5_EREGS|nr:AFR453Wp [Eremothecium gossypii ATCC 10895]Q752X0.5 RecName: Full=Peroxisomal targeting signal receptor; Short=PTS1 receptor; Short=PTS1R; AltName: Full=Peroxin-5 [Eremothecium gossypii ATCC 10895]AAS53824.3 AFR453Wp [Eremothecium gossypii ATCC 10895]AEY98136.1 FAFR453Wp [Eremothecium gossypii FDAG1]
MSADCSVGANPLAQLNKRVQQDRTLQHGSHVNIHQGAEAQAFKSGPQVSESNKFQMEQFMAGKASSGGNMFMGAGMSSGPLALGGSSGLRMSPGPAKELGARLGGAPMTGSWSQEFNQQVGSPVQSSSAVSSVSMSSASSSVARAGAYRPMNMMRPVMGLQGARAVGVERHAGPAINDAAWEQQFQELEKQVEKTLNISDPVEQQQVLEELSAEAREADYAGGDYEKRFQQIWNDIHDQTDDLDSRTELGGGSGDYQRVFSTRPAQTAQYAFETDNQYLHNTDAYKIGCILMENGAKLSEAALAFEAAVQQDPGHVDAWLRLGLVQTQNEKELSGINALEQCLKADPHNLMALMTVAISYINEGYDVSAFTMLGRWLETKYPAFVEEPLDRVDRYNLSRLIIEQYLRVANALPEVDPDVQLGLGILFYANEDFDKTIDCFRAALAVRPDDECMWNRLGASLANSNRSEEAIQAYHRAIQLKPTFVRARYNLAVSSMNIGCYREAAEHLLTALSMHEVEGVAMAPGSGNVPSSNILETLKRAFIAMDRRDLLERVVPNMDLQQFRGEFNF